MKKPSKPTMPVEPLPPKMTVVETRRCRLNVIDSSATDVNPVLVGSYEDQYVDDVEISFARLSDVMSSVESFLEKNPDVDSKSITVTLMNNPCVKYDVTVLNPRLSEEQARYDVKMKTYHAKLELYHKLQAIYEEQMKTWMTFKETQELERAKALLAKHSEG